MAFTGPSDFVAAMTQGSFDSVIGEAETAWLEFKSQPYLPWDDDRKMEFAKDASAMANGGGGVIVLGYQTTPDTLNARDVVTARTPVKTNLVDINGYRQALSSWTHPPMVSVTMKWWGVDQGRGILTIEVPAATDAQQPILVVRATSPGLKRAILVGHFVRAEDQVNRTTAADLHTDIQVGRIMRRYAIQPPVPAPSAPVGPTDEQRRLRLESDTEAGGFNE